MSAYPWGESTPSQLDFNLPDSAAADRGRLLFREQGRPPVANAEVHDWAAVVGASRAASAIETGPGLPRPAGAAGGLRAVRRGPAGAAAALRRHRLRQGRRRPARVPAERAGRRHAHALDRRGGLGGRRRRGPARGRRCAGRPREAAAPQGRRARGAGALHPPQPAGRPAARPRHRLVQAEPGRLRPARRGSRDPRDQRRRELPAARGPPRRDALPGRRLARLPVAVRHRRRVHRLRERGGGPVRARDGPPARPARRERDRQRRQRQGGARGGDRRHGLLRLQRRRRQHRRDGQVPHCGGAAVALDRRRPLPRRALPLRPARDAHGLGDPRRGRRRLARGPGQRRARGHGRGEARRERLRDPRPLRPGRPGAREGRSRHRALGGAARAQHARRVRGRLVDARAAPARRLAARARQREGPAAPLDRRDADGGRAGDARRAAARPDHARARRTRRSTCARRPATATTSGSSTPAGRAATAATPRFPPRSRPSRSTRR